VRKSPVVRWLRSNWKWGLAGFLGLGVGAAVAAGGAPKSRTVVENHTVTQTHTQVVTVRKPPKTKTVTVTAQTPAPAPAPAATPAPSTGAGSDYSGSGEKNVGTISVPVDSVLKWHATGGFFTIYNDFNDANTIDVSSQAGSGETSVSAGKYHKVDVIATGDWGFTISPK
jgi:hypothetical protein